MPAGEKQRDRFTNKEIIIKEQHNCRLTDYWKKKSNNFLLAYGYICVLRVNLFAKS